MLSCPTPNHTSPPAGGPRDCATAQISTAASAPGFWREYLISTDCELRADGSLWRYGDNLAIAGTYPHYTLTADTGDLSVDLELTCTDVVTWFVDTPIYKHASLLTRYTGTITHADHVQHVEGLCAFEHAIAWSGYSLARRVLPEYLKIPLDFFTYQVLDLGGGAQVLLTHTEGRGHQMMTAAFLRTVDGRSLTVGRDVSFEVLEYQDTPATTPDGFAMALPKRFRWRTPVGSAVPLELECEVDTPFNWGLGNGYVGGYRFTGTVDGLEYNRPGGYIEYIDRRPRPTPLPKE